MVSVSGMHALLQRSPRISVSGSTSFFWISKCVIGCTFHSDEEDVVCDGGLRYVSGASRLMTITRIDSWGSKIDAAGIKCA